jgi:hypothetical protein
MKYVGPLLFAIGVIVAISGGAKVPAFRIEEAEEKIAKEKKDEEANGKEKTPKEIEPQSENELRESALEKIVAEKEKEKKKEEDKNKKAKEIKFEMPDTKWYFTIGIVLAGTGLGFWWKDIFAARSNSSDAASDTIGNPLSLLKETTVALNSLELVDPTADELCGIVDEILANSVMPMIEVRQRLIDTLGMSTGAEVLVIAAAGERLLNRTWSAAADGDIDEALDSIRKATQAFAEAQETVNKNTLQHTKLPEFRTIT